MNSLNNKRLGTRTQKIWRIVPIKNYIIDALDSSQEIKRLCRYMTKTPLLPKGKTYDGKIINQPDVNGSLKGDVDFRGDGFINGTIVYPYAFTEDVIDRDRLTIYVHSPRTTINNQAVSGRRRDDIDDYTARHLFYVDIVYPLEYNNIEPYGEERAFAVAQELLDIIDDLYIEGETREIVGDCYLRIEGEILNKRLSVTGYGILSIPVWTTYITTRIREDLLVR